MHGSAQAAAVEVAKVAEALRELGRSKNDKLEGLNPDTVFSKENIFWAFSILFSRCVRLEGNAASIALFFSPFCVEEEVDVYPALQFPSDFFQANR